jgi:hypothetical protein
MVSTISLIVGDVSAVAGGKLTTQRHPFARHHQGDIDLLAFGPMVAAVAAVGQEIG